jgi:hypothetical protein
MTDHLTENGQGPVRTRPVLAGVSWDSYNGGSSRNLFQ